MHGNRASLRRTLVVLAAIVAVLIVAFLALPLVAGPSRIVIWVDPF
jgi:hypothetical protein